MPFFSETLMGYGTINEGYDSSWFHLRDHALPKRKLSDRYAKLLNMDIQIPKQHLRYPEVNREERVAIQATPQCNFVVSYTTFIFNMETK